MRIFVRDSSWGTTLGFGKSYTVEVSSLFALLESEVGSDDDYTSLEGEHFFQLFVTRPK